MKVNKIGAEEARKQVEKFSPYAGSNQNNQPLVNNQILMNEAVKGIENVKPIAVENIGVMA